MTVRATLLLAYVVVFAGCAKGAPAARHGAGATRHEAPQGHARASASIAPAASASRRARARADLDEMRTYCVAKLDERDHTADERATLALSGALAAIAGPILEQALGEHARERPTRLRQNPWRNGTQARDANQARREYQQLEREVRLTMQRAEAFLDAHGPEESWSDDEREHWDALLDDVRATCIG